ncbi:hypothetical protein GCM10027174_43310 [Salinifilum aidingensis]
MRAATPNVLGALDDVQNEANHARSDWFCLGRTAFRGGRRLLLVAHERTV